MLVFWIDKFKKSPEDIFCQGGLRRMKYWGIPSIPPDTLIRTSHRTFSLELPVGTLNIKKAKRSHYVGFVNGGHLASFC